MKTKPDHVSPFFAPYPTAVELNAHLAKGGAVQVTTYGRSTIYKARHAGMFTDGADGSLYVARGRSKDRLATPTLGAAVSIRLSI